MVIPSCNGRIVTPIYIPMVVVTNSDFSEQGNINVQNYKPPLVSLIVLGVVLFLFSFVLSIFFTKFLKYILGVEK